uniref:Transposase n=1 Tax=Aromatoleum buckelii TaxID=200254 RepID=A0ABX1N7S3_9RHOO
MSTRRQFSREFRIEAVKLVRERSVSVAQAARDLDVHENVLRKGGARARPIRSCVSGPKRDEA